MALKVDYAGYGVDICLVCGLVIADGEDGCRHLFETVSASPFFEDKHAAEKVIMEAAYKLMHPDYYCVDNKNFAVYLGQLALAENHLLSVDMVAKMARIVDELAAIPDIKVPIFRGYNPLKELETETDETEFIDIILDWSEEVYDAYVDAHEFIDGLIEQVK